MAPGLIYADLRLTAACWGRWAKWRWLNNGPWIMGRIACMGQDVLSRVSPGVPLLGVQKGRVDFLEAVNRQSRLRPRTTAVAPYLAHDYILPMIHQQEVFSYCLPKSPPTMLLMDSFAELTDQLFVHNRERWQFCCHYSDLQQTTEFQQRFDCRGLLDVDRISDHYEQFFGRFRDCYGPVPVVFLHFPVKLDSREKFRARYQPIVEAIEAVKRRYPPFYSLEVDETIVDRPATCEPGLEDFPYHYNDATYESLAAQMREVLGSKRIAKRIAA